MKPFWAVVFGSSSSGIRTSSRILRSTRCLSMPVVFFDVVAVPVVVFDLSVLNKRTFVRDRDGKLL